jgi:hypothetical protein
MPIFDPEGRHGNDRRMPELDLEVYKALTISGGDL